MKQWILLGALVVILAACGTTREEWQGKNCSAKGGFDLGFNDAKYNRRSGLKALQKKCAPSDMEVAVASYEKGFKKRAGKSKVKHEYGQDVLQDVIKVMNDESSPAEKKKPPTGSDSQ